MKKVSEAVKIQVDNFEDSMMGDEEDMLDKVGSHALLPSATPLVNNSIFSIAPRLPGAAWWTGSRLSIRIPYSPTDSIASVIERARTSIMGVVRVQMPGQYGLWEISKSLWLDPAKHVSDYGFEGQVRHLYQALYFSAFFAFSVMILLTMKKKKKKSTTMTTKR